MNDTYEELTGRRPLAERANHLDSALSAYRESQKLLRGQILAFFRALQDKIDFDVASTPGEQERYIRDESIFQSKKSEGALSLDVDGSLSVFPCYGAMEEEEGSLYEQGWRGLHELTEKDTGHIETLADALAGDFLETYTGDLVKGRNVFEKAREAVQAALRSL